MSIFGTNLTIAQKLPILVAIAATIGVFAVGLSSYFNSATELNEAAKDKLVALTEAREAALSDYLQSIVQDIRFMSTSSMTKRAVGEFTDAWNEMGFGQTQTLQRLYINDNPHPTGSKEELDYAPDGSLYSVRHQAHHPWFRQFLRERGYYDIFLFDLKGNLVYTVFKELDYATNMKTGEWASSDLANAYRAGASAAKGDISFFDFKPYAPSHGAPASFISTPIFDQGRKVGVLVFQMPIGRINAVMGITAGLGKSGETYLIGSDFLMRSDSRFSETSTILERKVDTEASRDAIAGNTGSVMTADYRGVDVLSVYKPIDFLGTRWAVLGEIDASEINGPVQSLRNVNLIIGSITIAIVVWFGFWFSRSITGPLGEAISTVQALSNGNTQVQFKTTLKDEIGTLAQSIDHFRSEIIKNNQLQDEQQRNEMEAQRRLKDEMIGLSDALDVKVQSVVSTISQNSSDTADVAKSLRESAGNVGTQCDTATSVASEFTEQVGTVASAADELTKTIHEVNAQVAESKSITEDAVRHAHQTNETVEQLSGAAEKIDQVVELISDIASQTNLLALNATIEAARAGDAGKGFAVVASEVKSLANQTTKATDDIGEQVQAMQSATQAVVTAIQKIGGAISRVDDVSNIISDAVDQQGVATQDIADSAQRAATGSKRVTDAIESATASAKQADELSVRVFEETNGISVAVSDLQADLTQTLRESQAGDRRDNLREDINAPSHLVAAGKQHNCTILNISASGAEIECGVQFSLGDMLEVVVPERGTLSACVVWTAKGRIGVTLEQNLAGADGVENQVAA